MKADAHPRFGVSTVHPFFRPESNSRHGGDGTRRSYGTSVSQRFEQWLESMAACPWGAHAGFSPLGSQYAPRHDEGVARQTSTFVSTTARSQLYTATERARRDASPWTKVQAMLAPLQFAVCAVSLLLIVRYLMTGQGYALATGSILLKTVALYAIMITGSIWEKDVFGKWLFARAFFWEDMVSMVVLTLQTTYVVALLRGWGSPAEQMTIAIAAYAAYAVNASQFLMKLRAARLDVASRRVVAG